MKLLRALCLMLALMISCAVAETWEWVEEPLPAPTDTRRLAGFCVGIDPGHQAKQNSGKEAVAPGSDEMKMKVSSGTAGVKTGRAEYAVNLEIALQLRDALEALGCTVYMTREVNEVDISNQERALMMNDLGADIVLRLHCNGSTNKSANGIGLYVNKTGAIAENSYKAAELLLPAMTAATGARADGIFRRDIYTGLNWSQVPCILVEMGYMSNPEEDVKLSDPGYQRKLVEGMTEGLCSWFGV